MKNIDKCIDNISNKLLSSNDISEKLDILNKN